MNKKDSNKCCSNDESCETPDEEVDIAFVKFRFFYIGFIVGACVGASVAAIILL